MRTPLGLLKSLARAALEVAGSRLGDDALVELLPRIAAAWDRWDRDRDEAQLLAGVQALARLSGDDLRQQAERIAGRMAPGRSGPGRDALAAYLLQFPATLRRALRRPGDPTGTTIPPGLSLRRAEDLLPLLPVRLARFRPGDRPLEDSDLELGDLLGVTDYSEVWLARPASGGGEVSLHFFHDPRVARALREEAVRVEEALRYRHHPGLVPLLRAHLEQPAGRPLCLEYEYVPGGDLTGLVRAWQRVPGGPAPWFAQQATRFIHELAGIVAFAHGLRPALVHRDLKPANVLVRAAGGGVAPRVIGYGSSGVAARLALEAQLRRGLAGHEVPAALHGAWTPLYASPQQVWGHDPDPRDDVHALGVLWYQALTGNLGRGRPDRDDAARLEGLAPPLRRLLDACLSDAAAARPADAVILADELAGALGPDRAGRGAATVPPSPRPAGDPHEHAGPILIVARQGRADCASIGEAVRRAEPGTRILVRPGLYEEGLILDRDVEIVGDGPADAVIVESHWSDCVLMCTDRALVRGLTLRLRVGRPALKYFGVDARRGQLVLEDCAITSDSLACVAIHGATADPILRRCRIHDGATGGVFVWDGGRGTVEDCDVHGHVFAGVEIKSGANPTLRRCVIRDQPKHNGVMVWDRGKGLFEDCEITANGYADVRVSDESTPTFRRCRIHHGKASGVYFCEKGQGLFEDCTIHDHVNAEVEVKQESNPTLRRCHVRDGKVGGIFLYENARGLIEDCEISGAPTGGVEIKQGADPVVRRCRIHHGKASGVYVHENGRGTVEQCYIYGNAFSGIAIRAGGQPAVRKCQIRDGQKAGVCAYENAQGLLEDCDIPGNGYAGVEVRQGSTLTLRRCRVRKGKQGGLFIWDNGQALVEDCDIAGNTFAGVEIKQGANPTLCRCRIHDGRAGGLLVWQNGQGTIEDCTIAGNALAGLEITQGGNPTVRRCRIDSGKSAGVWVHDNGGGTVEDCDLTACQGEKWKVESGCLVRRSGNRE
jgi:F-box protein 11